MVFTPRIRPYKIVTLSWVTSPPAPAPSPPVLPAPPSDAPIGLDAYGIANTFTILEGTDDVAIRLNDPSEDLLEYIAGVDGVTINEIYVTSAEPTGTVKIYVAWEVQWE